MPTKLVKVALKISTWLEILVAMFQYVRMFDRSQHVPPQKVLTDKKGDE